MSEHFRIECSCGTVLAQCRCFSPGKRVEIRQSSCDDCKHPGAQALGFIEVDPGAQSVWDALGIQPTHELDTDTDTATPLAPNPYY